MDLVRDPHIERWSGHWVRIYLGILVIVVLIPGLLFAAWYASSWTASERSKIEQSAQQRARGIAAAIDREIAGLQSILTVLASSRLLQSGNLEEFYHQAVEVGQKLDLQITLRDVRRDEQVLNTAFPWGAPLLGAAPSTFGNAVQELITSGRPTVSGVALAPLIKQHVVVALVPVTRDGVTVYTLAAILPAERIADILNRFGLEAGWLATVIDRGNAIVARSEKHGEFVGKQAPQNRWRDPPSEGHVVGKTLEGVPSHIFFRQSARAGWSIVVVVPDHVFNAPLKYAIASFVAVGALLLLVVAGVANKFAGRIASRMGALSAAAVVERKLSEDQLRILTESVSNGIVAVDGDGRIVLLNTQMETMFGYGRDELIGQPIEILLPRRIHARHREYRSAFSLNPQARRMGAHRDLFGRRKDGGEFPIEVGLNPIRTSAGDLVMATMVDLTAVRQTAERLSLTIAERDDLRRRLMQAQEQERLRLARDLHDQTGQVVAAAMMELKCIESLATEEGRSRIRSLRERLERMGMALHRIALELRPASIDDLGLANALRDYLADWSGQFGIAADFYCDVEKLDYLSDEVRTAIYRIVQEALTNIAKHAAGATAISVIIKVSGSELQLTIEDNGCGFDATSPDNFKGRGKEGGLGLGGMRERLSLIGGDIAIESSIGAGTTLFIRIPLESERMSA